MEPIKLKIKLDGSTCFSRSFFDVASKNSWYEILWWSSNVWAKLVPNRHAISDRYQSRHLLKHPHAGSLSLDGPVPPTNSLANLQPFRWACRQREKRKTRKLIWIVFPYGKSIGRRDGAYQHALLKRWMMSSSVVSFFPHPFVFHCRLSDLTSSWQRGSSADHS